MAQPNLIGFVWTFIAVMFLVLVVGWKISKRQQGILDEVRKVEEEKQNAKSKKQVA